MFLSHCIMILYKKKFTNGMNDWEAMNKMLVLWCTTYTIVGLQKEWKHIFFVQALAFC